jgi:hypothetical protein
VLQHLTPTVIAEHLETSLAWACIADGVSRQLEVGGKAEDPTLVMTPPPIMDKGTPPTPAAKGKAGTGAISGRVDGGAPPRPPATPGGKANGNAPANEWRPADDLDVLEEELLPLRSRQ